MFSLVSSLILLNIIIYLYIIHKLLVFLFFLRLYIKMTAPPLPPRTTHQKQCLSLVRAG